MMINGKLTSSRALASRYTTRPCLLRSSLNCQATSRPKPPLLNREKEATALKSILVASPRAVHVLVGPRLLQHVIDELKEEGRSCVSLNGRLGSLRTPEDLTRALALGAANAFPSASDLLASLQSNVPAMEGISKDVPFTTIIGLLKLLQPKASPAPSGLQAVLEPLKKALQSPSVQPFPVLVLDEAQELRTWSEFTGDAISERKSLLKFFVQVTKEDSDSHVIMATSDYGFINWIRKELGPEFLKLLMLGDFSRDDAKEFLVVQLKNDGVPSFPLTEDQWSQVFEVCGGNAGLLRRFSGEYVLQGLDKALASLESLVLEDILNAHLEGGGDMHGFSATQFRIVMKGLLESKSGAVSWEKLVDDDSVGEKALLAMMEANLLACRKPSELALDIPPAAYGSYMAVATAFLPVHLHCMRKVAGDATFSNPK